MGIFKSLFGGGDLYNRAPDALRELGQTIGEKAREQGMGMEEVSMSTVLDIAQENGIPLAVDAEVFLAEGIEQGYEERPWWKIW